VTRLRRSLFLLPLSASLAFGTPSFAAEISFTYKTSFRNVTKDPDNVWSGQDLALTSEGTVTIHEYELRTARCDWLVSQIWNADCSTGTCPTRLVQVDGNGGRKILVDDMMHQIIPPDDPRFAGATTSKEQAAFAQHPFLLSADGKTLINGDFRLPIAGARP
jgi:hypothetical protein